MRPMPNYILNTAFVILCFLFSCAKKERVSPDLEQILGPVQFVQPFTVSDTIPNFANGNTVAFSAQFQNEASWVITITGAVSGAVKTFTGTGTSISISSTIWDGTANTVPSFRTEQVIAVLSFPQASSVSTNSTLSYHIRIVGTKNLNAGHVLVTDFSVNKIQNVYNGNFAAVPPTMWPSNYPTTVTSNDIPFLNPDGNPYCTDGPQAPWQPNTSYIGHISPYIDHLIISATSVGYPTYFPLIADPTQIYFNIMVYSNTLPNYTWLQVILNEESPTNPDSVMGKTINIYPNWNTGWKLVTASYLNFKFSDTTIISNNPQKIKSIQLTLLSSAPQAILDAGTHPVQVSYDHLIFSQYKPYQP
jgi:hypothetical protein